MNNVLKILAVFVIGISQVFAQQRSTLVEQFTNSGCPTCAASVPAVYTYANTHSSDLVVIAYHTSFPYNDSMYHENAIESDARVAYYGIGGVPYSIVDGNVYTSATSQLIPIMSSTINNRNAISPGYDIQSQNLTLSGLQLTGQFNFTSLSSSNEQDSLLAHIVVIEKNVSKSSYSASPGANSETEYGYVMRKMIPDVSGTILQHKALNHRDTINFNWQISQIKNISEVRVVAFVQNVNTKEVYQAQLFSPNVILGLVNEENDPLQRCTIFPNPTKETLDIVFQSPLVVHTINFYDTFGKKVYSKTVNELTLFIKQAVELNSGIYTLEIEGVNSVVRKRVLVVN